MIGIGYHWPNLALIHGFDHVFGHNPLRLRWFYEATRRRRLRRGAGPARLLAALSVLPLDLRGPARRAPDRDRRADRARSTSRSSRATSSFIARTNDAYVYENPRALPRVMLVRRLAARRISTGSDRPAGPPTSIRARTVLLERAPPGLAAGARAAARHRADRALRQHRGRRRGRRARRRPPAAQRRLASVVARDARRPAGRHPARRRASSAPSRCRRARTRCASRSRRSPAPSRISRASPAARRALRRSSRCGEFSSSGKMLRRVPLLRSGAATAIDGHLPPPYGPPPAAPWFAPPGARTPFTCRSPISSRRRRSFPRSRSTTRSRRSRSSRRARPSSPDMSEREILEIAAAAREARLDRRRQRHRHPARQAAEARAAVRPVRAARPADRFRGARRPAGRSRLSAARAGGGRRRSSQGARPRRAAAARPRHRQDAARVARRRGDLRGADAPMPDPPRSALARRWPRVRIAHRPAPRETGLRFTRALRGLRHSDHASSMNACSVHADGLELVAPRVGDRRLARVGEHDRRAVGGMQREQLRCPARSPAPAETALATSSERIGFT